MERVNMKVDEMAKMEFLFHIRAEEVHTAPLVQSPQFHLSDGETLAQSVKTFSQISGLAS